MPALARMSLSKSAGGLCPVFNASLIRSPASPDNFTGTPLINNTSSFIMELETTMTVKSNTKTTELATLRDRRGQLIDEKLKEVEEDDEFETASVEVWEKETTDPSKLAKFLESVKPSPPSRSPVSSSTVVPASKSGPSPSASSRDEPPMYYYGAPSSSLSSSPNGPTTNENHSYDTTPHLPPSASSGAARQLNFSNYHYHLPKSTKLSPPKSQTRQATPSFSPKPKPTSALHERENNFELPVRVVYETFI